MKKLILLSIWMVLGIVVLEAQAPEKFSYQAVIRDASNNLVVNQMVGLQISIRQYTDMGTIVYQETHTAMTNINGLVSLEVGGGMTMDNFSDIDWGDGPYYIQTGIDPTGVMDYNSIMGTTELISVPYALYAANTKKSPFYVGKDTLGGVVFYVHTDAQGNQRGLIVAIVDQSTGIAWSTLPSAEIGATAQSTWNGAANTAAIFAQAGGSAASLCTALGAGWYLPAKHELSLLWQNLYEVEKTFENIMGATNLAFASYWSSTENNASAAWSFTFFSGNASSANKGNILRVRAVRAFSYSAI